MPPDGPNDKPTNLPEQSQSGVLTCAVSVEIDAPLEKVWEVLTDFPKYPEWNSFVRSQEVTDKDKKKDPDQRPVAGKYLVMRTNIPPTMDDTDKTVRKNVPFELIGQADDVAHRLSWNFQGAPWWFLRAERWQALSMTADGRTLYESREVFGGVGAYFVKWFIYKDLTTGFEVMAENLKARCEDANE